MFPETQTPPSTEKKLVKPEWLAKQERKEEQSEIAVNINGEIKKFETYTDLMKWAEEQQDRDVCN